VPPAKATGRQGRIYFFDLVVFLADFLAGFFAAAFFAMALVPPFTFTNLAAVKNCVNAFLWCCLLFSKWLPLRGVSCHWSFVTGSSSIRLSN
jgi:hypothetical protein